MGQVELLERVQLNLLYLSDRSAKRRRADTFAGDVADLRAILRLIEAGALDKAAEAIDCLDTLIRDQIPICLYAVVPGN